LPALRRCLEDLRSTVSFFNIGRGPINEQRDVNGIHNPFENPTVPLTAIGLDNVYGLMSRSEAGESVTQDIAPSIPVFWRCIQLLSTVIAGCPLRAYRIDGREEVFPDILSVQNTNMRYTQYELWSLVVAHMATWGNAYVLKYRDPTVGRNTVLPPGHLMITDLRPINPGLVEVSIDPETREKIFKVTQVNADGTPKANTPPLILTTYEVMHVTGLSLDGVTGIDPVRNFVRTLGTSIAADKLAARFYSKGTMLSGVINIRTPLADQEQADQIRSRWIAKSGGVAHGAEVAVLDAETTFTPLTIPPDSLQFLESRRWQTTEIARIFGIPPHLVGDVEKSTSWGTGIEEQNTGFVNYTVAGYTNPIEQRVSREIITASTQFCEFDLNRLLRGSQSERYAAYNTGIMSGWMLRNEARQAENMEPVPGLDDALLPLNMQTVDQANSMAKINQDKAENPPPPPPVMAPPSAPAQGDDNNGDDADSNDEDN
jgi:HK97 family phage portal protein